MKHRNLTEQFSDKDLNYRTLYNNILRLVHLLQPGHDNFLPGIVV